MKLTEKFNHKQIGFGIVGILVLVLLVIYLGVAAFFQNHFLTRTTINGIPASGKNVEEIENLISEKINGYSIVLEERNNKKETMKGTDIALKPVFDGALNEELIKQNGFAWPVALFRDSKIEVKTMVDYDKNKLEARIEKLECMNASTMVAPENAKLSDYSKEKGYEIISEIEGTTINKDILLEVFGKAVTNLQKEVSLEKEKCYVKPECTKESAELKKLADTMNLYTKTAVTYEFGDKKEVLDGTTISQWLSVGENQEVLLSEEKVKEYINTLAETYNTAGKAKSLATSYGSTVTVNSGNYGWKIDKGTETAALMASIQSGESISKEPAYSKTARSHGANDYGNTYVEINITAQHLYYYKDGALVLDTDFVSGNEAKSYDTPTGAYSLAYKQKDKTLRGEGYATPVSFWMPFNNGVGFHDATWRKDFGGNYYKSNGSHGCINMPYNSAKKLYETIESDCPVLVYKLPGTESAKALAQDAAKSMTNTIKSIGEVTLANRAAVTGARAQYDGLNDTAKGFVSNYDVLVSAEAQIAHLDAQAAADATNKQLQSEAQPVINAINGISGITITLDKKGEVEQIRARYNALSGPAKEKVTNYNVLVAAEGVIAQLAAAPQ
ncbi:MAG: peptidoglycan binding domain-containing protein [Lachnospiraceae bacterium]